MKVKTNIRFVLATAHVVSLLLILAATNFAQGQNSQGSKYRDTKFPFSISYSENWVESTDEFATTRFFIIHSDIRFRAYLKINVFHLSTLKDQTSSGFAAFGLQRPDAFIAGVRLRNKDATHINSRIIKIAGRDAIEHKAQYYVDHSGRRDRVIQRGTQLLVDGDVYTFTASSIAEHFPRLESEFDQIVGSFRLHGSSRVEPTASESTSELPKGSARVSSTRANLRAEPLGDSKILEELPRGTTLILLTKYPLVGWYHVEHSGQEGWLHKSTVEVFPESSESSTRYSTYEIKNVGSLLLPSSMEVQSEHVQDLNNIIANEAMPGISGRGYDVILQQKGWNTLRK
ncbi:MAG: SH3 domain-containing protein [Aridibacter famidurans]|nr:SH3 domain-containing protein [Aridibacter famidurans]